MLKITNLWEKTVYTLPSQFAITPIYEYDISKANISILLNNGIISKEDYDYYYKLNREERQIKIGLMQKKNPQIVKILDEGFRKSRYNLCLYNEIQDDEIISIKKDSLFVTRMLNNTTFGAINFKLKNVYSMMIKISNLEMFFGNINGIMNLDIKGINDDKLQYHQSSYLSMLCELFTIIQNGQFNNIVPYILNFINLYDTLALPVEFYREFNQTSMYKLGWYYADNVSMSDIAQLDIRYNREFNREIYKVIAMIYFTYC